MTVTKVLLASDKQICIGGIGYKPTGEIKFPTKYNKADFQKLLAASALCNESKLVHEKKHWKILGDPTEGSLIVMAKKCGFDLQKEQYKKTKTFPFDSIRKRMSVIVNNEVFAKGAPDSILDLCTHIQEDGKVIPFTKEAKAKIQKQYSQMAEEALRVLAIAYRPCHPEEVRRRISDENETTKEQQNANNQTSQKILQSAEADLRMTDTVEESEKDLIFLGLVGMIDPPRPEIKPAVELCHKAGIRTIIITGDFGKTAKAIAQKINLADKDTPVTTGEQLTHMTEAELQHFLQEYDKMIFARVAPEHKKRIVNTLKKLEEVVAVTGDGVNDAPALKRADIGIAMGITGTDVSKEVANMILTDDSFASIVTAVKEGRRIYQNLKKFVWYIFSTNIGELTTIFLAIFLGILSPLTAVLILIINLGTDVLPALALGVDHQEKGIMEIPPRKPNTHIMNRKFVTHFVILGLIMGFIVIGIYLFDLMRHGWQWGDTIEK